MACHDSENIPKNILLTDDPNSTIIQMELECYMLRASNIPPPPPNMGNPHPPPPPLPSSGPRGNNSDEHRINHRQTPYNNDNRFSQGASSSNYPSRRHPVQIN